MSWIISPRERKRIKSAGLSTQIDVLVADVFTTLPGHHKRPLARTFIICTVIILACDSEKGFQNLHMHFRVDFALFQAKAQISSGVLPLLYSDKAPMYLLCTSAVIYLKELIVQTLLSLFTLLPYKDNFAESVQKCFCFFFFECMPQSCYVLQVCMTCSVAEWKDRRINIPLER